MATIQNKDRFLRVRITRDLEQSFRKAAKESGMRVSDWCREVLAERVRNGKKEGR